jgi:hypothetical protein
VPSLSWHERNHRQSLLAVAIGSASLALLHAGLPQIPTTQSFDIERALAEPRSPDFLPPDDPSSVRVICFLDVECDWCVRRFPEYIDLFESRQRRKPDAKMSMEVRHFPLDGECNPLVSPGRGSGGCRGAVVLEAVEEIFGDGKIAARARGLMQGDRVTMGEMSQRMGVDSGWLEANYFRLRRAVEADIDLGLANGILMTPTVVINGVTLRSPNADVFAAVLDHELDAASDRGRKGT